MQQVLWLRLLRLTTMPIGVNTNPREYEVNLHISNHRGSKFRYKMRHVEATSASMARKAAIEMALKLWPSCEMVAKGVKWVR